MASKSKQDAQSAREGDRAALPFEPKRKKGATAGDAEGSARSEGRPDKKADKKADKKSKKKQAAKGESSGDAVSARAQARVEEIRAANKKRDERAQKAKAQREREEIEGPDSDGSIPKAVSQRMIRRMAILSISPIAIGVGIFFGSYYLLSRQIVTFAPIVVLLTTMLCFGLGVVGLTYGMLSASWDDEPGSFVGFEEFKLNFGRIMDARRAAKASKS